jgi:hypothetical protein
MSKLKGEGVGHTPPAVQRTIDLLASKGSSIDQRLAAMRVASAHHEAMGTGSKPVTKVGRRQSGR